MLFLSSTPKESIDLPIFLVSNVCLALIDGVGLAIGLEPKVDYMSSEIFSVP